MAFGLEIRNINGVTQVDGKYSNMYVSNSGVFTIGSGPFPVFSGEYLLAFRNVNYNKYIGVFTRTGNALVSSDTQVEYLVLRKASSPNAESYGLQVYGEDGLSSIFDSSMTVFNIDTIATVRITDGVVQSNSVYMPTPEFGKRYYILDGTFVTISSSTPQYAYTSALVYNQVSETEMQPIEQLMTMQGYGGMVIMDYTGTIKLISGYVNI